MIERPNPRIRVGVHRAAALVAGMQLAMLVVAVLAGWRTGLWPQRESILALLPVLGTIFLVWGYFAWQPGRGHRDWVLAEFLLCLGLFLSGTFLGTVAQYQVGALGSPSIDSTLIAIDRTLGIDIPALVTWTRHHPASWTVLVWAYDALTPLFFVVLVALGLVAHDRKHLWQFMVLFHVTLFSTVAIFAVIAATPAVDVFRFRPIIDQASASRDYFAVRDGTLRAVPQIPTGLISFPSFHTAGALVVAWSLRRARWLRILTWPVVALLVASTVLLGAHYAVDVIAAAVLVISAIWVHRWCNLDAWIESRVTSTTVSAAEFTGTLDNPAVSAEAP